MKTNRYVKISADLHMKTTIYPETSRSTRNRDRLGLDNYLLLTDKTRIHLRSASVRTYTFFTTGIP
jgi:hypothetical protein